MFLSRGSHDHNCLSCSYGLTQVHYYNRLWSTLLSVAAKKVIFLLRAIGVHVQMAAAQEKTFRGKANSVRVAARGFVNITGGNHYTENWF
jgi:hypothetical protein